MTVMILRAEGAILLECGTWFCLACFVVIVPVGVMLMVVRRDLAESWLEGPLKSWADVSERMTKCLFSLLLALIVIPLVTAAVVALIAVSFVAIILLLVAAASVLLCAFVPLCSLVILMALPFLIDKLKSVGSFHLDRAVLLCLPVYGYDDAIPLN